MPLAANSEYAIGTFKGQQFVPEVKRLPGQRVRDFYAAQSFSDVPDGRRIFISWWWTETRGMPLNQSMSLPLELPLTPTSAGPRMTFAPIKELESLRERQHVIARQLLKPGDQSPLVDIRAELVEVRGEFEPGATKEVAFNIRDITVEYDVIKQELSVASHRVPTPLRDGKQLLVIDCDRTGAEVFASDGLCYMPMPYNTRFENQRSFSRPAAELLGSIL